MEDRLVSLDYSFSLSSTLVFLLILISHCIQAVPVFDPNAPGLPQENFDPAEADPRNNITCLGDRPDMKLPILGNGFDPNQVTMQKLCAKPQYNGGRRGEHAGGFCLNPPNAIRIGEIAFDFSLAAEANTQLQNSRFLLACTYRCFCNYRVMTTSIQPKADRFAFQTYFHPSFETYELQLDIDNDLFTPRGLKLGERGSIMVPSARILKLPQLDISSQLARLAETTLRARPIYAGQYFVYGSSAYLSLDPGNTIECRGDLPTFSLPSPYTTADFTTVQQMCATQPNGGKGDANAGGYCHRSDTEAGPTNTVWFSDDMTPRLEWTWAGGNFFASAAIRYWCWQRCRCTTNPARDNATLGMWAIVQGQEMAYRNNGAMYIQATGPVPKGQSQETEVLPPQSGVGSPSGTCGASGRDFCPQIWDEAIYGAVPRTPPGATEILKPPPSNPNATVCGNRCNSVADCGSPDAGDFSCSCALPSVPDAKKLGLDPVAQVAICLALFASSVKTGQPGGKRDISGEGAETSLIIDARSVQAYVDERGVSYTCKCNETFTADACCRSKSGIVYSEYEFR